jgi:membrane-bound lytic murein transglycosylase A
MRSTGEVRAFLESEFDVFRVRNPDQSETGIITGYFEPLLFGDRRRSDRFRYPVYGLPGDLYYLDARLVKPGTAAYARIDGRNVVPVSAETPGGEGLYRIDLGAAVADLRDRRYRVRIAGDRIVPYWTRQEIEANGISGAPALAWVDDPSLLYIMQIQGSGRIQLPSGETLRVAFAEQNGQPFMPKVLRDGAEVPVRTRGGATAPSAPPAAASPEVQNIIDLLLMPRQDARDGVPRKEGLATADRRADGATVRPKPGRPGDLTSPPVPRISVSSAQDPSYVFFREIAAGEGGPPGALGVPLTPGRSIAVDPRVTPLGAPVFVSVRGTDAAKSTNRLMVAQDTGGAIRGAVRADYFWGVGRLAGLQAMRMKDDLRMWLLLPKGTPLPTAVRTRGLGDNGPECLVPDDELCVE